MTALLFYEKPIPLNKDLHLKARVRQIGDFAFARPTNSIPLAAIEFFDAARAG